MVEALTDTLTSLSSIVLYLNSYKYSSTWNKILRAYKIRAHSLKVSSWSVSILCKNSFPVSQAHKSSKSFLLSAKKTFILKSNLYISPLKVHRCNWETKNEKERQLFISKAFTKLCWPAYWSPVSFWVIVCFLNGFFYCSAERLCTWNKPCVLKYWSFAFIHAFIWDKMNKWNCLRSRLKVNWLFFLSFKWNTMYLSLDNVIIVIRP